MRNLLMVLIMFMVSCADRQGPPGLSGPQGQSCTVKQTTVGALITCGDTQALVYNGTNGATGPQGMPGTNGTSCSVSQTDSGAVVNCTDDSSATVSNGTDGTDGSCTVTQTDTGATIDCSDGSSATISNGTTVDINHGHDH